MHKGILSIVGASLLLASAAFASLEAVTLKRTAKVGETFAHKLTATFEVQGMSAEYMADITEKVVKVGDDGSFVYEVKTDNQVINVGGAEQPAGDAQTGKMHYSKTGLISKIESDAMDESQYRFANTSTFIYPSEPQDVGSKWSHKEPANKDKGTVNTEFHYELVAFEKLGNRNTAKVKYDIKETEGSTPVSSVGHFWIDTSNGVIAKSQGEVKNAPVAGMILDLKFTQQIVK